MIWSFNKGHYLVHTKGLRLIQGDNASCDQVPFIFPSVSSILWGVSSILRATAGWCYSTEGQEATSPGNTSLPFQLFIYSFIFFSPPCHHQSQCPVVYSTCNGNGCPWRTGCCWTPCGPGSTSQAWWDKKKNETQMKLHLKEGKAVVWTQKHWQLLVFLARIRSWYDHAVGAWRYAIFAFWVLEQKQKED